MPGIFGGIGPVADGKRALEREFLDRWPDAVVQRSGECLLGGHAFSGAVPVHSLESGTLVGLDGEWSLYREAVPLLPEIEGRGGSPEGALDSGIHSAGNVAFLFPAGNTLRIAVDASGTFPLYFVEAGDGILFSSLLVPLARAVSASRDDLATLEFLRQAYTVGGKTVYRGIRRLLPGQALQYDGPGRPRILERSRAWAGSEGLTRDQAAEQAWSRLEQTMRRGLPGEGSALMMSGGWDSRTLLAGADGVADNMLCYSHGDTASRELRIVRELCRAADRPYRLEPLDNRVLDMDLLHSGFRKTENVVFPQWHRAGRLLAAEGIDCVAAGVFGEILGGHYGPAMLAGTAGKIRSIAMTMLGLAPAEGDAAGLSAREYLGTPQLGHHWYLNRDFEASLEDARQRMDESIEQALQRLGDRGVEGEARLVEAFVSEHRGTQYINAQLLSCRASADIFLPFAGRELFVFSTRVPLSAKIHNTINRRMLEQRAPALLRAPMAATLVPAGWPLLLQETSRVARKVYEVGRSNLHRKSGGRVGRPRLGWVNFEFLRDTRAMNDLVDDLRSDLWDRDAIRHHVQRLSAQRNPGVFHPMFDQFAKVYTADLLLR